MISIFYKIKKIMNFIGSTHRPRFIKEMPRHQWNISIINSFFTPIMLMASRVIP